MRVMAYRLMIRPRRSPGDSTWMKVAMIVPKAVEVTPARNRSRQPRINEGLRAKRMIVTLKRSPIPIIRAP